MTVARLVLAELADDPDALAELRQLLAVDVHRADVLLTPAEVAGKLGVSTRTVNRWATEGRLPAVKVGRGWRFNPSALDLSPAPSRHVSAAPVRRARRVEPTPGSTDGTAALLDLAGRGA